MAGIPGWHASTDALIAQFDSASRPLAFTVRCVHAFVRLGVCAAEAKSSTYVDNDGVVGGDEGIRDGELPAVYTGTGFAASPHVD